MDRDADERELLRAERDLQAAQRAGDVPELERLLHPELLAVGPDGGVVDRESDLDAHRRGLFRIDELHEEELRTLVAGDTAVTFALMRVRGAIGDDEVAGRLRYTRTWTRDGDAWRVLAAHISAVEG